MWTLITSRIFTTSRVLLLHFDVEEEEITYKHIPTCSSDQRSEKGRTKCFCAKGIFFLRRNSSVFIHAKRGSGGSLNMRRSFITKGPSVYLRDRPDRRSSFCLDVVKIYLVKIFLFWGGTIAVIHLNLIYFLNKIFL